MGEQSAARLEGDRYQHLYSWYELLNLLPADSPYDHAYVEHPTSGSADDITLHPKPAGDKPAKYVQVKFHRDHRNVYSFDSLIEAAVGSRSLLHKLYDSWKKLKAQGSVEVWLVSNWAADGDLGGFIDGRQGTLSSDLLSSGNRSKAGKAVAAWKKELNATDEELAEFCKDLRLRLGFAGISDLEESVDDRMARHGLRTGKDPRAIAIDAVSEWIERGGDYKRITRDSLLAAIDSRKLRAPSVSAPTVSLWIHGWTKRAYDQSPTVELDWTSHFDRASRRVPAQAIWDEVLFPELLGVRNRLSVMPGGTYIDLRGKMPLTTMLAIGATFPEVAGYRFRLEQPTRGETFLWRSDAKPTDRRFRVVQEHGKPGHDILVAFCITGTGWKDIEQEYKKSTRSYSAVVYAEPDSGPGEGAIASDGDAVALAIHAKELIRIYRAQYQARRVHLIVYGPAAFSLLLGQRLNAVGPIVTYERTADGNYQTSVRIETG